MNEREIAVDFLLKMEETQAYGNIGLRKVLADHPDATVVQKAFVTQLVNGVLRNRMFLDYALNTVAEVKTEKMKPFILQLLRVSAYQLLLLTKVPASAAVNEAVNLTKARGFTNLSSFVNGVLRNLDRNKHSITLPNKTTRPADHLSIKYSYPKWLVDYYIKHYSVECAELICSHASDISKTPARIPVTLCTNTLKTTADKLAPDFKDAQPGIVSPALLVSGTSDIARLPAFRSGRFHVMNQSAMLAVESLDPQPGETIIDVCSAPGGKAFLSAAKMNNTGRIIALDKHAHKTTLIEREASRLGINIIKTSIADASIYDKQYDKIADRVLADVPCTGLGTAGTRAEIRYNKSFSDIKSLAKISRSILDNASRYVKPGGTLVYSTCTLTIEENIYNIQGFLTGKPFTIAPIDHIVEIAEKAQLAYRMFDGCIQIFPQGAFDGFFIACLKRKA